MDNGCDGQCIAQTGVLPHERKEPQARRTRPRWVMKAHDSVLVAMLPTLTTKGLGLVFHVPSRVRDVVRVRVGGVADNTRTLVGSSRHASKHSSGRNPFPSHSHHFVIGVKRANAPNCFENTSGSQGKKGYSAATHHQEEAGTQESQRRATWGGPEEPQVQRAGPNKTPRDPRQVPGRSTLFHRNDCSSAGAHGLATVLVRFWAHPGSGHHVPPPHPYDVGDGGSHLGKSSQGMLRRSVAGKMEISSYTGVREQVRFAPCTDFWGKN